MYEMHRETSKLVSLTGRAELDYYIRIPSEIHYIEVWILFLFSRHCYMYVCLIVFAVFIGMLPIVDHKCGKS